METRYPETIIGYDCREMWLPNIENWTDEERKQSLLRQNIKYLPTAGKESWNSLFVFKSLVVDGHYVGAIPNAQLEIPPEFEEFQTGTWENLEAMRHFMQLHSDEVGGKPYWMIAITVVELAAYQGEIKDLFQSKPAVIDSRWTFLGYDVEDTPPSMWEGLIPSRYGKPYHHELSEKYGKHLNEYHLFSAQVPAIEFCEWQTRKEGHAYWVYGLYLIEAVVSHE